MRILIYGDAGRGKTTLAKKLEKKLGIKSYSTDVFFWEKKYDQKRDKNKSISMIKKICEKPSWIIEGTTKHLIIPCLEFADVILLLKHNSLLFQYKIIYERHKKRLKNKKNPESKKELLKLFIHLFKKRYSLIYSRKRKNIYKLLDYHKDKIVELHTFKEIDNYVDKVKNYYDK